MDTFSILTASFIVLVGLQLCVPEAPNGKFEANLIEKYWTDNPLLRIVYGLLNIIGVIFVLGFVVYLMFSEHWWYIAVYIVGLILAKLVAFIFRLILTPCYKKVNSMYAQVVVQRIVGITFILLGMISLFVL